MPMRFSDGRIIETCRECGGKGWTTCYHCHGSGSEYDIDADGNRVRYICPKCNGSNTIPCHACDGKGYIEYFE